MPADNPPVLNHLAGTANGGRAGRELYYNNKTGRFEVLEPRTAATNPDVVVAPYDPGEGFFVG